MKIKLKLISALKLSGIIFAVSATYVSAQPPMPRGTGSGQVMGMGPDKMVTKHMKMMDQDGNEKLSQQEFMDFHKQRFQQMDVNGDGSLDTEEFSMGMRAMRRSMKGGAMSPPAQQMNPQQNHGQPPSQLDVQKSNQGQ